MKNKLTTKSLTRLNILLLLSIIVLYVLLLVVILLKIDLSEIIEQLNIDSKISNSIMICINRIFWTLLDIIIPLFTISYIKWIIECKKNIDNIITKNIDLGISLEEFKIKPLKKYLLILFYPYMLMSRIIEKANILIRIGYVKRQKELSQTLVDILWIVFIFYVIFDTFFVIYMVKLYGLFSVKILESSIYYIIFLALFSILICTLLITQILKYSKFEEKLLVND